MSSTFYLYIMVLAGALSFFFAVLYKIAQVFKLHHRYRLILLRTGFILVFALPMAVLWCKPWSAQTEGLFAVPGESRSVLASQVKNLWIDAQESYKTTTDWVLTIYLYIALTLLLRLIIQYAFASLRLCRAVSFKWADETVCLSSEVQTPFVFGLINPKIFVPTSLPDQTSERTRDLILCHERIHIENQDLHWKMLSLITRAILFYSPAIYYLHCKLDLEMEMQCDLQTMQRTRIDWREYGAALIKLASKSQLPFDSSFVQISDSNLKRRIMAMGDRTFSRPWIILSQVGVNFIVAISTWATSAALKNTQNFYMIKAEILVDGTIVSKPQIATTSEEEAVVETGDDTGKRGMILRVQATEASTPSIPNGIGVKLHYKMREPSREVESKLKLILRPGEETVVTAADSKGQGNVLFKLTIERR